jgi:hypothetical protein
MKKIIFAVALTITGYSYAADWNECQYQQNPQQCMQGVPAWQQTPAPIQQSGQTGGVTQGRQIQLQQPIQGQFTKSTICNTVRNGNNYSTVCN